MLSEGQLTLFSPAVFKFMHLSVKAEYVNHFFPFFVHTDVLLTHTFPQ